MVQLQLLIAGANRTMLAKPSNPCMKYEVQAGLTKTKKEKKEQKSNITKTNHRRN